ncbi:DNA-directed RNA polymerase III subunit RPC2, partial [Bonamia ostreae]
YKDIHINQPSFEEEMCVVENVTPHECRLRDTTYSSSIVVDVEYVRNTTIVHKNNIKIGNIPMMLKSDKCILADKTEEELSYLEECPHDPGGYFIVNGTERVILIQEQVFKNRILVERNKDKNISASVTSSTEASKSRTEVYLKNERMFVRANKFTEDIPAVVLLKAMGLESDQEVVHIVGLDYLAVLSQSIEQCRSLGIDTAEQALQYIGNRIRYTKASKSNRTKTEEARFILISVVLSHIPSENFDFYEKGLFTI